MSNIKKVKVGYVGMIQLNFRGDKESVYNKSKAELEKLSAKYNFDLYVYPKLIVTKDDAYEAKKAVEDNGVDLLLLQNTSFCSGYLAQVLSRVDAYIGLWAVPETTAGGPMPLNSFCGINLSAALIQNYLKEYSIKYKWFYGYGEYFEDRLAYTIPALRAYKNLKGRNVSVIGGVAPGFDNFYDDERLIEKRFGVQVARHDEFEDIAARARGYDKNDPGLQEIIKEIGGFECCITAAAEPSESLEKHARLTKAYLDLAAEMKYDAIAPSCWPKSRLKMGITFCATFGLLNDKGLITVCEGDAMSAVSMLALKYMSDYTPSIMDLSNIDFKDDSAYLWHCGIGSKFYAKKGTLKLEDHFNPGPYDAATNTWATKSPVCAMEFDDMHVSIMRFTHESSKMFLMDGDIFAKPGHAGSGGWLKNMRLNGEAIDVKDLIHTIMARGFHHHYPLVKGDYTGTLMELAYLLDLQLIERENYAPYNRP